MTVPATMTPPLWSSWGTSDWLVAPVGEERFLYRRAGRRRDGHLEGVAGQLAVTARDVPGDDGIGLDAAARSPACRPRTRGRPAALTLKVCVVSPVAPTSSVTVSVTVTSVSSVNVYVWVGLCSVEVLSGLVGSPKSQAQDAMVPSASVLPSVKVHSSEVHVGGEGRGGRLVPGRAGHGDLTLEVIGRAFVVGDAQGDRVGAGRGEDDSGVLVGGGRRRSVLEGPGTRGDRAVRVGAAVGELTAELITRRRLRRWRSAPHCQDHRRCRRRRPRPRVRAPP